MHLLTVLRRGPGDTFDAGLVNGPRGKGTLQAVTDHGLLLEFTWTEPLAPLCPIHLLIGLPRPQTARDLLRDATTLGVGALHFVASEKGEASYAASSLWKSDRWRECVISGAAQAFCTRIPAVTHDRTLAEAIAALPGDATRLALDNYEADLGLSQCTLDSARPVALALGGERGWSAAERTQLRQAGFRLAHLGPRVLRTETACVAALTLVRAKLGLI